MFILIQLLVLVALTVGYKLMFQEADMEEEHTTTNPSLNGVDADANPTSAAPLRRRRYIRKFLISYYHGED